MHEVATLFALTQSPCQKWEALGYGKATLLYQRTQHVLQAARLLPAHRRLPHPAFLSGLWWKLLSLQPLRLLAYLPGLGCLRPTEEAEPPHFRSPWLKASWLKLAAKAVELGGSRLLLKEKKFSPGRHA